MAASSLVVSFDDTVNDWNRCPWDLVHGDVTQLERSGPGHGEEEQIAALYNLRVSCQFVRGQESVLTWMAGSMDSL